MNFRLLSLVLAVMMGASLSACGVDDANLGDETELAVTAGDDLALTSNSRFETFQGRDGQYYFHLLAGNGEIVLHSEGYKSFTSSQNGITSVQKNGTSQQRYLLREAKNGTWYFLLTATNGRIIGMSEMYASQANANRAVSAVMQVVAATNEKGPAAQGAIRFETFKAVDGKYYFQLRAGNGQVVLQSQAYASKASAQNATNSVINNGTVAAQYQVLEAKDGKFYFELRATNGRVMGFGNLYASKANAERGVAGVMELLAQMR